MVHAVLGVLLTFLGAGLANFGASHAYCSGIVATDSHESCGCIAYLRAFKIQLDTLR